MRVYYTPGLSLGGGGGGGRELVGESNGALDPLH